MAGMNVARFNFSHSTYEEHEARIAVVKKVREKLNIPIPIMLDTKGPEYRIKTFKDGKVFLKEGDVFAFTSDDITGDEKGFRLIIKVLRTTLKRAIKFCLTTGCLFLR